MGIMGLELLLLHAVIFSSDLTDEINYILRATVLATEIKQHSPQLCLWLK